MENDLENLIIISAEDVRNLVFNKNKYNVKSNSSISKN